MNRGRMPLVAKPRRAAVKAKPVPLRQRTTLPFLADILAGFPDLAQFPAPIRDIIVEMYYGLFHFENLTKCLRPQPYVCRINDMPYTAYPVVLCSREVGGGNNPVDDERISLAIERWPHMNEKNIIYEFKARFFMRCAGGCHCFRRYTPGGCVCKRHLTTIENGHIWKIGRTHV